MSIHNSVKQTTYNEEYFLEDCGGKEFYTKGLLKPLFLYELNKYSIADSMTVLDIGCGKGEFLLALAEKGARVIGIDYADTAIKLTENLLQTLQPDTRKRITVKKANARSIPIENRTVDMVFLNDIFEHLHDWELQETFKEIRRILKPNGMVVLHTGPNTLYYKFLFYRFQTLINRLLSKLNISMALFKSPKSAWDIKVHVNEQNPFSLRRKLRNFGFNCRIEILPNMKYYYDVLYKNYTEDFPFKKYSKIRKFLFLGIIFHWPLNIFLGRTLLANCSR